MEPFASINLLAGAPAIKLRHYLIGAVLGTLPGGVSLVVFQGSVIRFVTEPDAATLLTATGPLTLFTAVLLYCRERFKV